MERIWNLDEDFPASASVTSRNPEGCLNFIITPVKATTKEVERFQRITKGSKTTVNVFNGERIDVESPGDLKKYLVYASNSNFDE